MSTDEIESLLRRARLPELPPDWKRQILGAAVRPQTRTVVPRLCWGALAACWGLIFLLHFTTPDVPQGGMPFNYDAYAMRESLIRRFVSTGELDPPAAEPLHIESIFRLPKPQSAPAPPTT